MLKSFSGVPACAIYECRAAPLGTFLPGGCLSYDEDGPREVPMNDVVYLVGLVVVLMAILSFFGLR